MYSPHANAVNLNGLALLLAKEPGETLVVIAK